MPKKGHVTPVLRNSHHFAAISKVEQAQALVETGHEFVTDMNDMMLFKKPR